MTSTKPKKKFTRSFKILVLMTVSLLFLAALDKTTEVSGRLILLALTLVPVGIVIGGQKIREPEKAGEKEK